MSKLLKFKLNRDFVLVTKEGPSFRFIKGEVTSVPARYAQDAINIGADAVEEDAEAGAEMKAGMLREKDAEVARLERIETAVRQLVERNRSGDFTAGGKPNKKKVEVLVGAEVSDAEIETAFAKVKSEV